MSIKITSGVWGFRGLSGMSIGDKMTLLALADYADHDGVCYPSIEQLRQKSGLSRSQTYRCLSRLVGMDWITVKGGLGRGNRSVYVVHPKGRTNDTLSVEERVATAIEKGRNQAPQRVASTTYPLHNREPSVENHQEEPSSFFEKRYRRAKP